MSLTNHFLHLVPRLRMSGAVLHSPSVSLWVVQGPKVPLSLSYGKIFSHVPLNHSWQYINYMHLFNGKESRFKEDLNISFVVGHMFFYSGFLVCVLLMYYFPFSLNNTNM
jgi:hypothetical protein